MFIYELGVDEPCRRRGIAAALLCALAIKALELGCTGMWTGTERGNAAALAAYRSLGATVDTEPVLIQWNDLAESFGNGVPPASM
jgi:ribosomal protein S18 acetylase RimI-like enzyme